MKYLLIILFVLFIQTASAIRINEVELNPSGNDAGNEWVELYNRGEISLDSYKLVNNDGDEINLSGSFKGYYIYTFTKQWLDNSDEKIFLYKDNELVDETDLLEDDKNNEDTWSYCTSWGFGKSTRDEKNDCKNEENEIGNETIEDIEEEIVEKPKNITLETINLVPQNIKREDNNESSGKNYVMYGFIGFCILLVFLFILKIKKDRFNKNEFEK